MDYIKELYYMMDAEKEPDTPEYRENRAVRNSLLEKLEKAMGKDMADKIADIYMEREAMECERFFLEGLRLGLELLRL